MLKEYVIILSINIEKVNSHRFYLVMAFTQQYVGQHIIKFIKKTGQCIILSDWYLYSI